MYCKYAEYGCKLQTNLFMNSKQWHDMQKKCNIVFWICRICRYLQKSFSCSAKKKINKNDIICGKMQYRHPPIQEDVVYSHLDFIYIFKIYIEFRSFGGICSGILNLQKTRFGGPGKPNSWSVLDYGFLRFFMGFDEFLQVLDGFLRVVAKLLHQKPGFVD